MENHDLDKKVHWLGFSELINELIVAAISALSMLMPSPLKKAIIYVKRTRMLFSHSPHYIMLHFKKFQNKNMKFNSKPIPNQYITILKLAIVFTRAAPAFEDLFQ